MGFKINHVVYLGAPRVRAGRAEQSKREAEGVGGEREEVKGERTPSSLVRCKGGGS